MDLRFYLWRNKEITPIKDPFIEHDGIDSVLITAANVKEAYELGEKYDQGLVDYGAFPWEGTTVNAVFSPKIPNPVFDHLRSVKNHKNNQGQPVESNMKCSFCNAAVADVKHMVQSEVTGAYICNVCISGCVEVLCG